MCLLWSPFSCRPLPNYRMITLHGSCASESTLYSNLQWYFVNVVVQVFQYLLFVLNYKLERSSCWSITGIDGSEQLKTDAMDSTVFTCLHRVPQEYRHSRAWDVTTMVAQSKQQHFSSELSNTCGVNDMEHVETLLWYQWYPCRCSRAVARVKLLLSAVVRSTNFGNFVDGCASSVLLSVHFVIMWSKCPDLLICSKQFVRILSLLTFVQQMRRPAPELATYRCLSGAKCVCCDDVKSKQRNDCK